VPDTPEVELTNVPFSISATTGSATGYLANAKITIAAFEKEVVSEPAVEPFEGFRFVRGEEESDTAEIIASYPASRHSHVPDSFLNRLVGTDVIITVEAESGLYGPGTCGLLDLLQGTEQHATVALPRQLNAEESAEYERVKAEALEEELPVPDPPETESITVEVVIKTPKQLAPSEDYRDWNVLAIKFDLMGSFPQIMLPPDMTDVEPGVVENNAFELTLHGFDQTFSGARLIKPAPASLDEEQSGAVAADHGLSLEEFKTAMAMLGYPGEVADIEETFGFLERKQSWRLDGSQKTKVASSPEGPKRIGKDVFEQLAAYGAPASAKRMVSLRKFIRQKYDTAENPLEAAFHDIDSGGGGTIDLQEWHSGLQRLGCVYSPVVTSEMFQALDTEQTNTLNLEEFMGIHLFHAMQRIQAIEQARNWMIKKFKSTGKAFRVFDENHSGNLSPQEFEQVMHQYHSPIPDDTVNAVFRLMDVNYDNMLRPNEFEALNEITADKFLAELMAFKIRFLEVYGSTADA
jgi:Ca2+-binding EF-hand superfamily protein